MAIARRASDLAFMLNHAGVPVTSGAMSGKGVVREADEVILQSWGVADMLGRVKQVTVQSSVFAALAIEDAITVDGEALKVLRKRTHIDGQSLQILVVEAT